MVEQVDTGISHDTPIKRQIRPITSDTLPSPLPHIPSRLVRAIQAMFSVLPVPDARSVEAQIGELGRNISLTEKLPHHKRGGLDRNRTGA